MMYYLSVNTAKFFNGGIISGVVFDLALSLCGLPTVGRALDSWCERRGLQLLSDSLCPVGVDGRRAACPRRLLCADGL